MKKLYIFLIGIVIVAVLVGGGLYFKAAQEAPAEPPAIKGEVACLPLKNPDEGVNDTMCKKGLKNSSGMYLEVQVLEQSQMELGKTIEVEGEVKPPDASSKYQTMGTIVKNQ